MGIEPKNYLLSLADSTPLAAVTRSNPRGLYAILDLQLDYETLRREGAFVVSQALSRDCGAALSRRLSTLGTNPPPNT